MDNEKIIINWSNKYGYVLEKDNFEDLIVLLKKARQEGYREGFNEALRPIREFLKLIGVEK